MLLFPLILNSLLACSNNNSKPNTSEGTGGTACHEDQQPEQTQLIFYSTPYDSSGGQSERWFFGTVEENFIVEVDSLDIGRSILNTISFTPDGMLGYIATQDGSIQGISIDSNDVPTLLPENNWSDVYASSVVVDSTGENLWIVDPNWPENGGGVYICAISCDGTLSPPERIMESKNAHRLLILDKEKILLTAKEAQGEQGDLFIIEDGSVEHAYTLFTQGDAIHSAASVNRERTQVLIGENSEFSGMDNRLASYSLTTENQDEITPFLDPVDILSHPNDIGFLIVSGYGNRIEFMNGEDFSREEPSYEGQKPQLPGRAVMGLESIFLAENQGVRMLTWSDAGVQDNGILPIQTQRDVEGFEAIIGGLGIRPPHPHQWPPK
jgi:hypothetical protein